MFDGKVPKLLRDYLNYSSNLNKSSNTIKEYRYDLINFLKYIINMGDIKWITEQE